MSDIKKKFLDILFEPEDEENENVSPSNNASKNETVINKPKIETVAPRASDILYGKQEKSTSFIDYFVVPKSKPDTIEEKEEEYEIRSNVSPIFGLINDKSNKKKKQNVTEREIKKAVTNMPKEGEYTNIVLSPIYGYDDVKANDARKTFEDKSVKEIKEELHEEVNEDLETLFDDDLPFEIPNDQTIEIAKEAIMESVEEMNNKIDPASYAEKVQENINKKQEVINRTYEDDNLNKKDAVIEDAYEADHVYEDKLADDEIDLYTVDEKVFDDDIQESTDTKEVTQEIEQVMEDYEEPYTQEITKEDVVKAFENIEETGSFDTTPIQLFDYDDLDNSDDEEKDLLDEITGDSK